MIWVFRRIIMMFYYNTFSFIFFLKVEGANDRLFPLPPMDSVPALWPTEPRTDCTVVYFNWTRYNTVIVLLHRSNPRGLQIALLNRRSDNRERDFRQLLSFGRQFPVISCRLLRHELSVSGGIMQSVGARLSWRPSTFARSLLFYALRRGHDPAVALFVP